MQNKWSFLKKISVSIVMGASLLLVGCGGGGSSDGGGSSGNTSTAISVSSDVVIDASKVKGDAPLKGVIVKSGV